MRLDGYSQQDHVNNKCTTKLDITCRIPLRLLHRCQEPRDPPLKSRSRSDSNNNIAVWEGQLKIGPIVSKIRANDILATWTMRKA